MINYEEISRTIAEEMSGMNLKAMHYSLTCEDFEEEENFIRKNFNVIKKYQDGNETILVISNLMTITELERVQVEFNNQPINTFEKLDEMLHGLLSNAHSQSATDEGTPKGIEENYYYFDALDEDNEEVSVTALIKFNAEFEEEENNYDVETLSGTVNETISYQVPVNSDKWTIAEIDLMYDVK